MSLSHEQLLLNAVVKQRDQAMNALAMTEAMFEQACAERAELAAKVKDMEAKANGNSEPVPDAG